MSVRHDYTFASEYGDGARFANAAEAIALFVADRSAAVNGKL